MASFKVPCPSCEHQVSIKSDSLIGTKVECPKCKYRFKVEEPAGGVPKDAEKADKKKSTPDGAKKKQSKKTVAVVVGVLAVGVLGAVGYAVVGGGKTPTPVPKNTIPKNNNPGNAGANTGNGSDTGDSEDGKGKDNNTGDLKPKTTVPVSTKETSNLLHGQTAALYRLDIDKIRQTPTTILFDRAMLDMFRASLGLSIEQVGLYYHGYVGETRDPFGVIRLIQPATETDLVANMPGLSAPKTVKTWKLYSFKSNPFVAGVSHSLSFGSLFGELYERLPKAPTPPANRTIGMCVYDTQHILIGDYARLQEFLTGIDEKTGYPSVYRSDVGKQRDGVALADNPQYLFIDPKLKGLLKDLGSETQSPPAVVYAEKYAQGAYDPKLLKTDYQPIAAVLDPVLNRAEYLGAALNSFTTKQLGFTLRLVMKDDASAYDVVKDQLVPALTLAAPAASSFLGAPVEFHNLTSTGMAPTTPGTIPGTIPGTGYPMPGVGFPMPGVTGPGSDIRPPSVMPKIGGSGMGPPMPGPGTTPLPGQGGHLGSSYQPEPGMPMQAGPGIGNPKQEPKQPLNSRIDLGKTDQNITIAVELNWTNDTYRTKIEPRIVGVANTLKGKMAIFASDLSDHRLAATIPKMTDQLKAFPRGTADRKLTDVARLGLKYQPKERVSLFAELLPYMGQNRRNLALQIDRNLAWYEGNNLEAAEAWVPELLVSSYPQSAWRATSPYVADGRVLGGTNYVAISGIGLDSARYDPNDPRYADKVKMIGITGYDWGSKLDPNEIPDGLSNTIYLMQTPPGLSQPWIQGGGATVRGLDETNPMKGFAHNYTHTGQPGTYALMADGSVRFIPATINPKVLLAMSTRAGGEDLGDFDREAPPVKPKKIDTELKADPKLGDPKPADPKKATTDSKSADPKVSEPKRDAAPEPREKK
jgi:hypothetical protein